MRHYLHILPYSDRCYRNGKLQIPINDSSFSIKHDLLSENPAHPAFYETRYRVSFVNRIFLWDCLQKLVAIRHLNSKIQPEMLTHYISCNVLLLLWYIIILYTISIMHLGRYKRL